MKIRCLIVDDEPIAREGIESCISKIPDLQLIQKFEHALTALEYLNSNSVDLIFLDINMPEMTGIDLVKSLADPPLIIFTTAYREYAADGFDLDALDYLVKPIAFPRFARAVEKARIRLKETNESALPVKDASSVFIKSDGQIIKILLDDILFIEALKDYIFIHTLSKRYMSLLSLKQLESILDEKLFARIHRSYIVALDKVRKLKGNSVFIGEHEIPISRSLHDDVYKKIVGNRLLKR